MTVKKFKLIHSGIHIYNGKVNWPIELDLLVTVIIEN